MANKSALMIALLVSACNFPEVVERNCPDRMAFYPDSNGDGLGEPTDIFIGCKAPEGWVESLGPPLRTDDPDDTDDTGSETGDTADTGDTAGDTGDTSDTGTPDTATDTST
mgnify:CR=1 FL=1